MAYVAEDVPAHMVEHGAQGGTTGIDAYRRGATTHGACANRANAEELLAKVLESYAQYPSVQRAGESPMYMAGARALRSGVDGVMVCGRYYWVRDTGARGTRSN